MLVIGELTRPIQSLEFNVSQFFGERPEFYARFGLRGHNGLDYRVPVGTPVLAAHDGTAHIGYDPGGYGHFLYLVGRDVKTCYAHLSEIQVVEWQGARRGAVIALSGGVGPEAGCSDGAHLHWAVKLIKPNGASYVNPGFLDWVNPCPWRGNGR